MSHPTRTLLRTALLFLVLTRHGDVASNAMAFQDAPDEISTAELQQILASRPPRCSMLGHTSSTQSATSPAR